MSFTTELAELIEAGWPLLEDYPEVGTLTLRFNYDNDEIEVTVYSNHDIDGYYCGQWHETSEQIAEGLATSIRAQDDYVHEDLEYQKENTQEAEAHLKSVSVEGLTDEEILKKHKANSKLEIKRAKKDLKLAKSREAEARKDYTTKCKIMTKLFPSPLEELAMEAE